MNPQTGRACLAGLGIALVVAFFLPFFGGFSPFQIVRYPYYVRTAITGFETALLLMPVGGSLVLGTALGGSRYARVTAFAVGLALVAFGLYVFLRIFFAITGIGLWLGIVGALGALIVPLTFRER